MKKTILLMYHSIGKVLNGEVGAGLYTVSEENFRKQIECLKKLEDRDALITFDDGCSTNYKYAFPVLKEAGFKAYFFIIVSKVGTRGYMNWEQIKEIRDAGMIIGSHGMTHQILTELKDSEIDYELNVSKRFLEDNLGHPVTCLSIPRGFYNDKIIDKAKDAGYEAVFTSNKNDKDGFRFGRIGVKANWDLKHFSRVVNNGFSFKASVEEIIKISSKKLFGAKNYDKIRTKILGQ